MELIINKVYLEEVEELWKGGNNKLGVKLIFLMEGTEVIDELLIFLCLIVGKRPQGQHVKQIISLSTNSFKGLLV